MWERVGVGVFEVRASISGKFRDLGGFCRRVWGFRVIFEVCKFSR